ncbi:hypothetical protein PIB30_100464 [Stylosanthes scabra]|uniref:Uncharacterized protein n=1 Tax=Stylosanthes scabra TaxID=79078 RepID=A0ABU6UZK7_9FABA|nr:hypothetical protein [Stylosanthes scabra]
MILLIIFRKYEERKLAEQETKFGSKAEQELHPYAWVEHAYACYTKPNPRLGKSITLRRGNLFILSTYMRRSPRICMGSQQPHIPSHVYTTSNMTFTSPSLTHPRIGVEDPRICVEGTLAASNFTRPTHMCGKILSHV